jgi:membrane protein
MEHRATITRILALPRYYLRGLIRELYRRPVFLWAQAIAFKVLITIVPIVVLGTGLAAYILRLDRPFASVENLIRDFLPAYQSDQIVIFLSQLQSASGTLTLIGASALVISAVTLFTTLRTVLANVFQEEWHEHRGLLRGYVFDFRMTLQVGAFFIASTLITIARRTLDEDAVEWMRSIGIESDWFAQGWHSALDSFGLVLPLILSVAMFFQLIWLIPMPKPPKRSAFAGALFTATLWEIGKSGFTAYAAQFANFEQSALAALGDTFIFVIVIVFWAYFSGLLLALGAIVTLLHERKHRKPELMEPYYPSISYDEEHDADSFITSGGSEAIEDSTVDGLADRDSAEGDSKEASSPS